MIRLPADAREEILAHAREGDPEEVCGILGGERGDPATVETVHRATNAADTPGTRYEIAPAEQFELMEDVESAGREVVGFYHSHPRGPLAPSHTDADLAAWPGRSYLIASLPDGEIGSWRWTGEHFEREKVG